MFLRYRVKYGGLDQGFHSFALEQHTYQIVASYRAQNPLKREVRFKSPPWGIGLCWVKRILWVQKYFGSKKIVSPKKFESEKNCESKIFGPPPLFLRYRVKYGGLDWGFHSFALEEHTYQIVASYRAQSPLKREVRFKSPPLGEQGYVGSKKVVGPKKS